MIFHNLYISLKHFNIYKKNMIDYILYEQALTPQVVLMRNLIKI